MPHIPPTEAEIAELLQRECTEYAYTFSNTFTTDQGVEVTVSMDVYTTPPIGQLHPGLDL